MTGVQRVLFRSFKKVYIEITNVCNLSCDFCPKTTRKAEITTKEKFSHILEQVKPHTKHIYLHLLGEPTMHPELDCYLEMSHEKDLKVNLTTNGTLIPKVQDVLLNAPALRQVNISLHSFESNTSDVDMQTYLKGITTFINEATAKSNVICSLRLWNIDSEVLKGNNALNDPILEILEKELELDFKISEALLVKKGIKLKEQVYLNMAEKFEWPDHTKDMIHEEVFCYGLRDQIGILVDGTVVPCCLDNEGHINLGNIFTQPLSEILASKRSQRIYDGFSQRKAVEHLCKTCHYAQRNHKL